MVVDEGRLRLRNRIYREVFGPAWMKKHLPVNRARVVVTSAAILAVVALVLALFFIYSGHVVDPTLTRVRILLDVRTMEFVLC
ncbi:MAG: hypothetical protein HC828_14620 [Blastochloris sp.]|nr:hypothetical protein [Blastochloris sp.]